MYKIFYVALCVLVIAPSGGSAAISSDATSSIESQPNAEPPETPITQTDSPIDTTQKIDTQPEDNEETCENLLPADECAVAQVCDSTDKQTKCRQACGLCTNNASQDSESLEDGDGAPAAMVSRAEATRTYSIIGGSVGGFFVLVLVMSYWRRRNLEIQQELDSECYYFEPEAHTWVQEMENVNGHTTPNYNAEPAEPEPLTVPDPMMNRTTDSPSAFTGYESPNAYSHEYDQVLKKITEQSKASFDANDNSNKTFSRGSPLALYEFASDVEDRLQATRTPDLKNFNRRLSQHPYSDSTDHATDSDNEATDV
eukprot:m.120926 g.120926  ORF g.120926 m.120926 type:complete len:312 (-) comp28841_c1_seq2:547-1482(-)